MAEKCIFCDPAPGAVIFSGPDGIILLDDEPLRLGHVLVGAKTHYQSLHDLSSDDAAAVFRLANAASKILVKLTGAEKMYVVAIGDRDNHFHLHLIPKMATDPSLGPHVFGQNGWASFLPPKVDPSELQKLLDALRTSLVKP